VDVNKRTALHWAASNLNLDSARDLIKLGASLGVVDVQGKTPFHWAVSSVGPDSRALVQLLLKSKPQTAINWQDYEGRMPIHLAVIHTNLDIVSSLLSSPSCKINSLDNSLRTPLHLAAISGKPDICEYLLQHGAKYDMMDEGGTTAVHHAVQSGCVRTVEVFVGLGLEATVDAEGRTPLMWAAASGLLGMIGALKGNLENKDAAGYTALHTAVSCGMSSSCGALCAAGCDVNSETYDGITPLMIAAQLGYTQAALQLISYGTRLNHRDGEGRTAVHLASEAGQPYLIDVLSKAGATLNLQDRYGRSPLHLASYWGHIEVVRVLLDSLEGLVADPERLEVEGVEGVDGLSQQDNEGVCPLHWAVRRSHLDVVKLLLKSGAFPNNIAIMEFESKSVKVTPTDSALMDDNQDIVSVLLEHGGVRITRIYNIAATRIQAYWRGYRIRKSFYKRKKLFVKHEQLKAKNRRNRKKRRKETDAVHRKKKEDRTHPSVVVSGVNSNRNTTSNNNNHEEEEEEEENEHGNVDRSIGSPRSRVRRVAGRFLGSVVEGHQRSSYLRRVQPGDDQPLPNQREPEQEESDELRKVSLSTLLEPESRSESRFSYNLKQ